MSNLPFTVAALYCFAPLPQYESLREPLAKLCCSNGIKGTLLLAAEGINGTVAGTPQAIERLVQHITAIPGLADPELKYSHATEMPFHRMKVRLKREIVTMGIEGLDPLQAGRYVEPADWNALVSDPATIVIDTRNDYEVAIGTFKDAVNPETASFRDFPAWAEAHRDELEGRKVAMFCTGGIRCEKATAYVRSLGLDEVFHLKGGILKYLETVPATDSLWEGECFVFDERVSVGHGLAEGDAKLCRACRRPLTAEDRKSSFFLEGVSCAACFGERSEEDRARYGERHRQVELARARGQRHVGQRD